MSEARTSCQATKDAARGRRRRVDGMDGISAPGATGRGCGSRNARRCCGSAGPIARHSGPASRATPAARCASPAASCCAEPVRRAHRVPARTVQNAPPAQVRCEVPIAAAASSGPAAFDGSARSPGEPAAALPEPCRAREPRCAHARPALHCRSSAAHGQPARPDPWGSPGRASAAAECPARAPPAASRRPTSASAGNPRMAGHGHGVR